MPFREQIVDQLGSNRIEAQLAETRALGAAVYIGGVIDRMVKIDSTFINFASCSVLPSRKAGGFMYGVEAPKELDKPIKIHFVESSIAHADLADAIGFCGHYEAGIALPVKGPQKSVRIGGLYEASSRSAYLYTFFGANTFGIPTAKSLASVIINTLGADLLKRASLGYINCGLECEGEYPIHSYLSSKDVATATVV